MVFMQKTDKLPVHTGLSKHINKNITGRNSANKDIIESSEGITDISDKNQNTIVRLMLNVLELSERQQEMAENFKHDSKQKLLINNLHINMYNQYSPILIKHPSVTCGKIW